MISKKILITNKSGLHARPASVFVQEAQKQACDVNVYFKDKKFNAKSILAILSAGIIAGSEITIECDGPGEESSLNYMIEAVKGGLGE